MNTSDPIRDYVTQQTITEVVSQVQQEPLLSILSDPFMQQMERLESYRMRALRAALAYAPQEVQAQIGRMEVHITWLLCQTEDDKPKEQGGNA